MEALHCCRRGKIPLLLSFDPTVVLADQLKIATAHLNTLSVQVNGVIANNAPNILPEMASIAESSGILKLRCHAHLGNLRTAHYPHTIYLQKTAVTPGAVKLRRPVVIRWEYKCRCWKAWYATAIALRPHLRPNSWNAISTLEPQ